MDYSVDAIISSMKRRGSIPTSQALFSASDLVSILQEELHSTIVPLIMSVRGDHFLATPADTSIVSGTDTYAIPARAIGMKLREVTLVDGSGNETNLPQIELEAVGSGLIPTGFYMRGSNVVLFPSPTVSGTLRMRYSRRPNDLVTTASGAKVTAVNSGTKTATCAGGVPATITSSTPVDVIMGSPHFDARVENVTPSSVTGTTVVFTTWPTGLAVGDYINLTGESCIPQVPLDAQQLLAQAAVVKVMEALGDAEGLATAQKNYAQLRHDFLTMLTPRVDGEPRKVVSRSGIFRYPGWTGWRA